ncbi:MAG: hypothetical protein ACLUHA_02580 [Bacteroides stercoris]
MYHTITAANPLTFKTEAEYQIIKLKLALLSFHEALNSNENISISIQQPRKKQNDQC